MGDVRDFYNRNPEIEWARLDEHRTEFAVTLRALRDYLPPAPASVLDIGGGPGRYALTLAQQGYAVTLTDLAESSLDLAKRRARDAGVAIERILRADAVDLSSFAGASFDAALLMGPLYHLLTAQERARAVAEARRVLRPDGVIFAAFISRFAPFRDSAQGFPQWVVVNSARAERILATGVDDEPKTFTKAYFARPDEIEPLMESAGFQTLQVVGCEGIVAGHEHAINELSGSQWDHWVDLNYRLGRERQLLGAADHLLYVGRKVA